MLTIKENKCLFSLCNMHLLSILRLAWILILSLSALQAAQPIEHTTQEEPIVQSIWEHQIDPAMHRSATPLFNPANPNNLLQTPALPWNASTPSFMENNSSLMYNGFLNNPSMDSFCPLMDIHNPLESPFYNLPEFSLTPSDSFPAQNQPPDCAPLSSTLPLPAHQPASPPQTTTAKDKQATIGSTKPPAAQSKTCPYCGKK